MTAVPRLGVVIVAAGSGVRFGDKGKAVASLAGRPLLTWSIEVFSNVSGVAELVVVAAAHSMDQCRILTSTSDRLPTTVVCGGETRADSMRAGLAALSDGITHVAVHDAARPLVSVPLVERVLAAAAEIGAAIPVVPVSDTLHQIGPDGMLAKTLDRATLRAAQTPQIARRDWLVAASQDAAYSTDEGGLLHAAGYPVGLVEGDPANLKITWPEDLLLAEGLLAARKGGR